MDGLKFRQWDQTVRKLEVTYLKVIRYKIVYANQKLVRRTLRARQKVV